MKSAEFNVHSYKEKENQHKAIYRLTPYHLSSPLPL